HLARDRSERSGVVGAVAQRGCANLRARVPCEARLLTSAGRSPSTSAWAIVWCCAMLLRSGGAAPARAAVADYVGKPIGSVRVTIESRETSDPALTQVVETTAGQPLSMAAVRETITHLFSTGRFEGVSVEA